MKNLPIVALSLLFGSLVGGCVTSTDDANDGDSDRVESSSSSIVGGVEATPNAWNGVVFLLSNGRFLCGGSLIADEWVLTAGHCINANSPTGGINQAVVGRHARSSKEGYVLTVDAAYRHEQFSRPIRLDNDIALLHLSTKAPSTIKRAQLITELQAEGVETGDDTTAVGWGAIRAGGPVSDVLREVTVPVVDSATCKTASGYSSLTSNMICAGDFVNGGIDACQGDSGGPLFTKIGSTWVQIGLTSWGIGCAGKRAPGVYTRVANYLDWLYVKTAGAVGTPPGLPSPQDGGAPQSDAGTAPKPDAGAAQP